MGHGNRLQEGRVAADVGKEERTARGAGVWMAHLNCCPQDAYIDRASSAESVARSTGTATEPGESRTGVRIPQRPPAPAHVRSQDPPSRGPARQRGGW